MHIVHTEASCGWGGQELRILAESQGMIARGHRVTLLCPPEAKIYPAAQERGIPAVALPVGRKNAAGLLAMRRWLAGNPVDVVNTHSSTDSWLVALACATLGANAPPVVRTRHISAPVPGNAPTRWLYVKSCRRVVTTGERLRQDLLATLGCPADHLISIPTGIDTHRFAPGDKAAARAALGLPAAALLVGIVATLRSWKGHRFLIEAFARLPRPDARLVIVGDGPKRDELQQQIQALGLADRVVMPGNREDVPEWLRALDIFVLPSYANEGVPQALMQAMLSGLPAITTLIGGMGEVSIDDRTSLVIPPQDTDALAGALQRMAEEPALRARLGQAARAHCERHCSFEGMVARMEAVFARAVAEAAQRR